MSRIVLNFGFGAKLSLRENGASSNAELHLSATLILTDVWTLLRTEARRWRANLRKALDILLRDGSAE